MFGDILHGTLLLIFALICIRYEDTLKDNKNEMFTIPFGGRYLLVVMSVCAIYMGFIYNEVASVPLNLFGSAYDSEDKFATASNFTGTPYSLGIDPVWRWSNNNVGFTNSMKMKMAIILGVCHMQLGVTIKAFNNLYFNNMISFYHESIPETLLFMGVFGYLVILIFIKWTTNWNVGADCYKDWGESGTMTVDPTCASMSDRIQYPRGPPMIINTLIDFAFLNPVKHSDVLYWPSTCAEVDGKPDPEGVCSGQATLQMFLLFIAGVSAPWLLLAKPFILKRQHEQEVQAAGQGYENLGGSTPTGDRDGDGEDLEVGANGDDEDEHSFTEIFIHQVIHTIEYALGTVSNTASYLRLWALSLAHSQLSEVFWDMIFVGDKFKVGLCGGNAFMIVFCYPIWFFATMAVLMVMESLSAFLHALRLQWVEFQNKFYYSDGYLFMPDSYDDVGAD